MKTYIKYTGVIVLSFLITTLFSQNKFEKRYEKTFLVNNETLFKLSNKYGKVHIETNNSDKVEINVVIEVETRNKEKAEGIFKNIKINFDEKTEPGKRKLISAITEIDGSIKNTEINYFVKMPETLKIELSNKYGYIFIDKLKTASKISCKYGNLQINELLTSDLSDKAVVNLKYSNGTIEKCDYLNVDVKYSELNIIESRAVDIVSGYSDIEFNKAYIIKAVSKYDPDYTVNEVTKFIVEGKYSGFDIGILHSLLKASIKYSNIEIDEVKAGFESIFIITKYGNIEIEVDEDVSYKLNAKAEYGSISSKGKIISTDKGNTKVVSSSIGNNKETSSKITISAKYGNIEVE